MITAEKWYDPNPDLTKCYQGDILSGIPFIVLPTFRPAEHETAWGVLRPKDPRGRPLAESLRNLPNYLIARAAKDWPDVWTLKELDGAEYVMAVCKKRRVMLVSRSCDIDKNSRKHFLVAPVVAFTELHPDQQRDEEKLRDIRANEIFHWFYLPGSDKLPESYADLSQIVPLHRTFFDRDVPTNNLLARLSSLGTGALEVALSNFYGRQFGFAPEDICPQDGLYSCSSCFYSGRAKQHVKKVRKENNFGVCDFCGDSAMWVKLPVAEAIRVDSDK